MVIIIYQAKIGVCPGLGNKNDILGDCGVTSASCAMRLRFKRACLPCIITEGRQLRAGNVGGGRQQILLKSSIEHTIFVTHPPCIPYEFSVDFRGFHYLATPCGESAATAARVSTCCCDNVSGCEVHRHLPTWMMYAPEFQLVTSK